MKPRKKEKKGERWKKEKRGKKKRMNNSISIKQSNNIN
jgi:hypothetical protein